MKHAILLGCMWLLSACCLHAQDTTPASDPQLIDVVWLKDGSRLSGSILTWEYDRGLELKLASGTIMTIPKKDISHVFQQVQRGTEDSLKPLHKVRIEKPYAFKEHGLYHTVSLSFHTSAYGGTGLQYSIGHRFNNRLGVGAGIGYETNDVNTGRNFIPVFAEFRGFLKQTKSTPYYGFKMGYGFAVQNNDEFNFSPEEGKGGIYVNPEIGYRFGANKVNIYVGGEYKLQKASYTGGWTDYSYTDHITYRRFQLRCGIVF